MDELLSGYALNDGEIRSLKLTADYALVSNSLNRQASVDLLVRKKTQGGKMQPCLVHIHLTGVRKFVVDEDFESGYYSDVVFKRVEKGMWYLSLDPYGNSGEPHDEDNLVIVAEAVEIEEGVIQDRF